MMNEYVFMFVTLAVAFARNNTNVKYDANTMIYKEGNRFFFFPGEDGKIHLVDAFEPVDTFENKICCKIHNSYWLYTRKNRNKKQILTMGNKKSVQNSYFNPNKITVFTAHGWKGDGNTEMNILLTKVLLKNADINVIVLDWSKQAKMNYIIAKESAPFAGQMYGKFIYWLHQNFRMSLRKIHLIGHSLGGHLVGSAGRQLRGRAQRITALDPAGPLWYLDLRRLNRNDARYVEVIHTNSFMAGYSLPCGHSDHYPNGGKLMVGCNVLDLVCHHSRSWHYMAASIEHNKFLANKCPSTWSAYFNWCYGALGQMGNSQINKQQSGIYRVNTLANYPYINIKHRHRQDNIIHLFISLE